VVFWANTVVFLANTVVFWANTVIFWANTVAVAVAVVDSMFMIIQSLRSFPTAVTKTAVTPIAVTFTCIYLIIPKMT
jgi:hypothetical protein